MVLQPGVAPPAEPIVATANVSLGPADEADAADEPEPTDLAKKHRYLLRKHNVVPGAIAAVQAYKRMALRPGFLRVLTFNILAHGLSDDGFLCRHVLRAGGVPENFAALVHRVSLLAGGGGSEEERQKIIAEMRTPAARANMAVIIDWSVRRARILELIAAQAPHVICLQEMDHMAEMQTLLGELGCEHRASHRNPQYSSPANPHFTCAHPRRYR